MFADVGRGYHRCARRVGVERWPEGVSSRLRARAAAALRLLELAAQPVCPAAIPEAGRIAGRHAGLHRPTAVGQLEAGQEKRPQFPSDALHRKYNTRWVEGRVVKQTAKR